MEEAIIAEVSNVFGLSSEDTILFLDGMAKEEDPSETFFETILEKIPSPKYFYIPEPPKALNTTNMNTSEKAEYNEYYKEMLEDYQRNLERFEGRTGSLENEIHLNKKKETGGEFGIVMPNKNKPEFIYKLLYVNKLSGNKNSFNSLVKQSLLEPLINTILQCIPESKAFTCKLYKVYKHFIPGNRSRYEIIMKMENLQGTSVKDTLMPRFPFLEEQTANHYENNNNGSLTYVKAATEEEKKYNKRLMVKIMGPLYKGLKVLRDAYKFNHGDLHTGNIMFVENPLKEDGTFDESKLAIKMIDFGFSSITINEKEYGYYTLRYIHKEVSIFRFLSDANQLTEDIKEQVGILLQYNSGEQLLENVKNFELFIIQQKDSMAGGRQKSTRNQRNKKRRFTRSRK